MANHKQKSKIRSKLKLVLLLTSSNLLTIFLFSTINPFNFNWSNHIPLLNCNSQSVLRELNSTQFLLSQTQSQNSDLHRRLHTTNSLLKTLIGRTHNDCPDDLSAWGDGLSGELKLAVGPHKLPFGFTPQLGTDELYLSLGSACRRFQDELVQYMNYTIGGDCPVDDIFAQRLMLKGCEPLPRRRCHPKSPSGYINPSAFPSSLWSIPPDTSIIWEPYTCKNYTCLIKRWKSKGSYI